MEETGNVAAVVVLCVIASIIGYVISGLLGTILGFVLTLFVFVLFRLWKRYNES